MTTFDVTDNVVLTTEDYEEIGEVVVDLFPLAAAVLVPFRS